MKCTSASCVCWLQVLTAAQVLGRTVHKSFLTGDGQQEVFTGHVLGRRRNWWVVRCRTLKCYHVHSHKKARDPEGYRTTGVSRVTA